MTSATIPASAAPLSSSFDWTMTNVQHDFTSRYWDTAQGSTVIHVESCGADFPNGGSGATLDLWRNLAWQRDVDDGARGYGCAGSGGRSYGGDGQWSHTNGRFYFKVNTTPNSGTMSADGTTRYPG
jgi:hypothetical protein